MKKGLKRWMALLTAGAMAVSMVACGTATTDNKGENAGKDTKTETAAQSSDTEQKSSFIIGYPTAPSNTASMAMLDENRKAMAEAAGGTLVSEVFDFTPEGTIDAIQKLIEQDNCDGVIVAPMADSVMTPIVKMCEEYGVYFSVSMRSIEDEDIKDMVKASPYYAGMVYEDNYNVGYSLGEAFAKAGGKKYGIISNAVGDASASLSEAGLAQASADYGIEFVEGCESRGASQASDVATAVESWLASNPDLDGIIRLTSTAAGDVSTVASTLEKLGVNGKVKFFTADTDENSVPYIENGTITGTLNDILLPDTLISCAMLINAIQGTPVSTEELNEYVVPYTVCEDYKELNIFNEYVAPPTPKAAFSAEQYQNYFLKSFNPDVTLDSIIEFVGTLQPSVVKSYQDEAAAK